MATTVRCPICSKLKHIYRKEQRSFYCCGSTHLITEQKVSEFHKKIEKKLKLVPIRTKPKGKNEVEIEFI